MTSEFFISCPLGFEDHLITEINDVWPWLIGFDNQPNSLPVPEMVKHHGGVLVPTEFHLGIQLNFFLKTANRILWRLAEFKVRDFPKLFEKVSRIPWSRSLKSSHVEWVVAASASRLNNEKRIEATCEEAFKKAFQMSPNQGKPSASLSPQKIYVRVHDDLCSISLDTTGEHLHKRGWGIHKGEAPLRETLSAFMLREMMSGESVEELSQITLVDPMCGSGTLLLEAASLLQPVFEREFSFLNWANTPKIYSTPLWRKNYKKLFTKSAFKAFVGFDAEPKSIEASRKNLELLKEKTQLKDLHIEFQTEDLFSGAVAKLGRSWTILNPPYGERLRVQNSHIPNSEAPQIAPTTTASVGESATSKTSAPFSYQELLNRIEEKYQSEKIGLLLPNKSIVKSLKPPMGYAKALEASFSNGGLDVIYLIYARKN